jgi:uroporphyrinogen-III synthase
MTGVVITASAGSFPGLVEALRAIPAVVEEHPLMSFAAPVDWGPVDRALEHLARFSAIAFTSPRAAGAFAQRLTERRERTGNVGQLPPLWASGGTTADAVSRIGPVQTPSKAGDQQTGAAEGLARALLASGVTGAVLFPCGELRRDELPARLRQEGVEVEEVICYRSVLAGEREARSAAEGARLLVVASPSVAQLLARACPSDVRPPVLAVGPTTAAAARACGWPPVAVAPLPTAESLADTVRVFLATR